MVRLRLALAAARVPSIPTTLPWKIGSTLQVDEHTTPTGSGFDGARIHVGTDLGEGSLTIQSGGIVNIQNLGTSAGNPGPRIDGAALGISNVPGVDGTSSLAGRVDITNGTLLVETNANNGSARIGVGRDGTGTLNATGSSVTVQAADDTAFFSLGGTGTSGPLVTSQGTATFDNSTLTVNSDSTTTGSAFVSVGRDGNAGTSTLNINNGSVVTITNNAASTGSAFIDVGRNNTTGFMNIDASTVSAGDFVSIGRDGGTGTMSVTGGGTVDNTALTGLTRVGRGGGTGTLNVTGTSSQFSTNNLQIGRDASSTGTVTVNTGGTINAANSVLVGRDSNTANTMTVGAGGTVNARSTIVGSNTGSNGIMSVSGAGAQLNLTGIEPTGVDQNGAFLGVGSAGTGVLNVNAGGTVTISPGIPTGTGLSGGLTIGGSSSNPTTGNGTVNVDGAGSSITFTSANGQAGFTQVGRDGTGVLNITNGGTVSGATQNFAIVGRKVGATGSVNITGAGSSWTTTDLFIGTEVDFGTGTASGPGGNGTVNVANGGALFANNIINGATGTISGGGGTINANIQSSGTIGPGNSPGLMSVVGNVDLLAGSTLAIELGGLVVDTGYDRLDVVGITDIAAGSIFDIDFFGGFVASLGDSFDILVSDDITLADLGGLIFDFSGALLGTGLEWQTSLDESGARDVLRISVAEASIPEPSTLPLFASLVLGAIGMRRLGKRTA